MKTDTKKQQPSIEEKTARLAKSIATRMDRGESVHKDEMEHLQLSRCEGFCLHFSSRTGFFKAASPRVNKKDASPPH